MKKTIYIKSSALILCISGTLFLSAGFLSTSQAPEGYTGAGGVTCQSCHGGNSLNASGGSLIISGLPDNYTPGTTYNFSVTINHASPNRSRWGFAVKAIGSNNIQAGSFSSLNANAGVIGQEIGHVNAPSQSGATYTFNNLRWTAPSNPLSTEQTIRFFAVGNAANGVSSSGDFIYTATKTVTQLPLSVNEQIPEIENWGVQTGAGFADIQIKMKQSAVVQAALYSLSGQEVRRLTAQKLTTGQHKIFLSTSGLSTGTYIIALLKGNQRITKKIVIQ